MCTEKLLLPLLLVRCRLLQLPHFTTSSLRAKKFFFLSFICNHLREIIMNVVHFWTALTGWARDRIIE